MINLDKYNLERFIKAQEFNYEIALNEIKNGKKVSHWIWYIFPQIDGLGHSSTAKYYAISCLDEAKAYLNNNILKFRLVEICEALLDLDNNDPIKVMGYIDAKKLKSSMTLFNEVSSNSIFKQVLDKYYYGKKDNKTLDIIKNVI
jgi:uncharacterized protein (DUF1810 family)